MLIDRLMAEGHIYTDPPESALSAMKKGWTTGMPFSVDAGAVLGDGNSASRTDRQKVKPVQHQRICLLAMCGIHLGPLGYLSGSLVGPYLQVSTPNKLSESQSYNHNSYAAVRICRRNRTFRVPRYRKRGLEEVCQVTGTGTGCRGLPTLSAPCNVLTGSSRSSVST